MFATEQMHHHSACACTRICPVKEEGLPPQPMVSSHPHYHVPVNRGTVSLSTGPVGPVGPAAFLLIPGQRSCHGTVLHFVSKCYQGMHVGTHRPASGTLPLLLHCPFATSHPCCCGACPAATPACLFGFGMHCVSWRTQPAPKGQPNAGYPVPMTHPPASSLTHEPCNMHCPPAACHAACSACPLRTSRAKRCVPLVHPAPGGFWLREAGR